MRHRARPTRSHPLLVRRERRLYLRSFQDLSGGTALHRPPETDLAKIRKYCRTKVPAHLRDQIRDHRLGVHASGPGGRGIRKRLDFSRHLRQETRTVAGSEGLGAEMVHYLHVVVQIFAFVQVEGAGELLGIYHVR
jgi:hypothetical protein